MVAFTLTIDKVLFAASFSFFNRASAAAFAWAYTSTALSLLSFEVKFAEDLESTYDWAFNLSSSDAFAFSSIAFASFAFSSKTALAFFANSLTLVS